MALGSDLMLKLIIAAEDLTKPAVSSVRGGLESISATASKVYDAAKRYLTFTIVNEGIGKLRESLQSVLDTGGQFENYGASLASLMGSVEGGKQAFAWIQQFAKDTPYEIDDVTQAFVKMKAFGLDPMDGSLKAFAEQNAKMGGSAESLSGIVLALGQAWTKQKLQAEDANQLLERGVPVWDMLAKVLNKTSAEVMAMSQSGEIGRKEIKLLIDEMGRSSSGALEAQMKTWNGLVSNLKDSWTQFLNTVASSGALDYFKSKIAEANAEISRMSASGELQAKAEQISNAFVNTGKAVSSAVGVITSNLKGLTTLAEGLAIAYGVSMVKGIAAYVVGLTSASRAEAAHTAALKAKQATLLANLETLAQETALRSSLAAKMALEAEANLKIAKLQDGVTGSTKATTLAQKELNAALKLAEKSASDASAAQVKLGKATFDAAEKATMAQKAMSGLSAMANAFGPIIAAVTSLKFAWDEVSTAIDDYKQRQSAVKEGLQGTYDAHLKLKQKITETQEANRQYADTAIASNEQINQKKAEEVQAYAKALEGAQKYWSAVAIADKQAGDMDGMAQAERKVEAYGQAIDALKPKLDELAQKQTTVTGPLFDNTKLEAFASALKDAATGTAKAKQEWEKYAKQVSDADLAKILESAKQKLDATAIATGNASTATTQWAGVVNGALRESMTRAGFDAEMAFSGITGEVKKSVDNIGLLSEQLMAVGTDSQRTGQMMYSAFADAVGKAKTAQDLQAIRTEMDRVWQSGSIGKQRMDEIYALIDQQSGKIKVSMADLAEAHRQANKSADELSQKIKAGTATQADYAKASHDSANALKLQSMAAQAAGEKTGELSNAEIVAMSVASEKAAHNASVAAVNRQIAAEHKQQADAKHEADKRASDDGVQYAAVQELMTAALLEYGDAGRKAITEIINSSHTFDSMFIRLERWRVAAAAQADGLEYLRQHIIAATETGRDLGYWIDLASQNFDHLDKQRLDGLNAALDAARQKVQALEDQTKSAKAALQDELDQLEGNTRAIEERKFQAQREKLQLDEEMARSSGSKIAEQNAQEAKRLADEIHQIKMAKLENQDTAKPTSPSGTGSALPRVGEIIQHNVRTQDGRRVTLYSASTDKGEVVDLFKSLEQSKRSST